MSNADKSKFSVRIDKKLVELIDEQLERADARSRTELIENALRFYLGYLTSKRIEDYLLKSISSVIISTIRDTENRLARMDFKTAYILDKLTHVIAYTSDDIDEETMRRLHIMSIEEVSRLNGAIRATRTR
jgi:metal-responsive CopG/Arc/MetJ family transcriptional regulator